MSKYAERIAKSKDEKEKANLEINAAEADLQFKKAILDAKVEVKKAEGALEAAKSEVPLEIEDLVIGARIVAKAKQDLADLEALQTELF